MDKKKIKVYWSDAVIYTNRVGIKNGLTKMITTGELFIEKENFIVIRNPKSIKENEPLLFQFLRILRRFLSKRPTYFFIPRGMIRKIINV